MNFQRLLVLIFVWLFTGLMCNAAEPMQTITYCDTEDGALQMDVMRPKQDGIYPALIMLHGGGWRSGSRQNMHRGMQMASSRGYIAIAPSYRLLSKADDVLRARTDRRYQVGATGFEQLHDVKCAILYVRKHAKELFIDPNKIAVFGRSSGAHMAMMAGMTSESSLNQKLGFTEKDDVSVAAIIEWMGPVDLLSNAEKVQSKKVDRVKRGLTGCWPSSAYTDKSCLKSYQAYSPLTYIDATAPPILTLHGKDDKSIAVEQGHLLQQKAKEVGFFHELVVFDDVEHKLLHSKGKKVHPIAWAYTFNFLDRILKGMAKQLPSHCELEDASKKKKAQGLICYDKWLNFPVAATRFYSH